jgi:transcriptional regulator GlxA family with amidase domain
MRKIAAMHRIAVLALDGVVAFDLATPPQVFCSITPPRYEPVVCGPAPTVRAAHGFGIAVAAGLEALERAQTVIVPGVQRHDGFDPAVLDALRAAAARGARMASICTGAFVLAAAGLLDGRRATTHWRHVDELRERFPRVRVEPGVLYVDEGDLLTSAGVAAGIDLCLHLLRSDHGAAVANEAARRMVVAPHRDGGQAQFIDRPLPPAAHAGLEATRQWMLERLDQPLTVADCARHAGFAPRSFARRFRAETGTTPLQWLLAQRVLAARRRLEQTDEPVETIAARCGFGTATALREHFRRACATTPSAYRAAFSATARATSTSVRTPKPEAPLAA